MRQCRELTLEHLDKAPFTATAENVRVRHELTHNLWYERLVALNRVVLLTISLYATFGTAIERGAQAFCDLPLQASLPLVNPLGVVILRNRGNRYTTHRLPSHQWGTVGVTPLAARPLHELLLCPNTELLRRRISTHLGNKGVHYIHVGEWQQVQHTKSILMQPNIPSCQQCHGHGTS